jgi:type II secretory pathway component GspD/PulD (secretin)
VVRYRVFSLRHISANKGKEYLAQLKIGTVSQLPGANVLLVTASPRRLIKASAIMKLVDAEEEFAIKQIPAALLAQGLPPNKQIAAKVADITIGTFSDPPAGPAQLRAIIDVHDNAVVVIAPAKRLEKIVSAIGPLQEPKADVPQPAEGLKAAEPNQTQPDEGEIIPEVLPEDIILPPDPAGFSDANQTKENELFSKLLESLAEAERMAAEPNEQVSRPNEPNIVTFVAEPNEPNAIITVAVPNEPNAFFAVLPEVNVPTEPYAEQPKGTELAAILERLKALEAKVEPEPVPKEVTVEIGQPNEVEQPVPEVRYEPEPIPDGEEPLTLHLPDTLPITDFLSFMGENLHLDYLYDPKKVTGSVTLRLHGKLRGDIKRKDLYPLLESVLQFNGFVMTRKENLVLIVPEGEADRIDAPIVRRDKDRPEHGDVIITRVFKLKHIDTTSAKNILTGMQLGLANKIREVREAGTLLVTGYAYRMPRIEEILQVVDRPGKPKKFRYRQLQYTMAGTLAPKVKSLAEQLGTISVTVAAPAPTPRTPAQPIRSKRTPPRPQLKPKPGAVPTPTKPTVYLDADERTNRILMIGLDEQLDIVSNLINTLDVKQQDLRTLALYEIQNVDAEDVRTKLAELGIVSAAKAPARGPTPRRPPVKGKAPTPTTTPGTTAEPLAEEPQIVIIESTNSLLVNATADTRG